jgi:hypothetical protein
MRRRNGHARVVCRYGSLSNPSPNPSGSSGSRCLLEVWKMMKVAVRRASFDHLIGAHQHGRRHIEAERLGGLHVEHGLNFTGACTGRSTGFSPLRMRST